MSFGRVIKGNVMDCNKKHLEAALKQYDSQLYIKWNSEKRNGEGIWEVRRRPNEKTAWPKWEMGGSTIFELIYVENDLIHHVMDVPVLNYNILTRIKEMDTWGISNYVDKLEQKEKEAKDKVRAENRAELRYGLTQIKRATREFKDLAQSGNILDFITGKW